MNRLAEIISAKRREVNQLRSRASNMKQQARARNDFRDFRSALQQSDASLAVIAEIKKASPSAGLIAPTFEPGEIAKSYERDCAIAVSVLTDTKFFLGKLQDLTDVRRVVSVPLLRKDFILD